MKSFYVTYRFSSSKDRETFLNEVKEAAEISRGEQGCLKYEYYYPVDDEYRLLLWEQWETEEDQIRHTKQSHFLTIIAVKEKYGAETDVIKV